MPTITQFPTLMQDLFTAQANAIGKETGFIQRQRKLTGAQFLQATVFGWLQHPSATRQQLHQSLLLSGANITAQGFEQRFRPQAVTFLRAVLEKAISYVFEPVVLCPILERFQGVYLTDSTRLEAQSYPLKVAARLELQRGLLQLSLEDLETHDNVTGVCHQDLPAGALHIGDLGFFDLDRFSTWAARGVEWISRYKMGTVLYDADGRPLDLTALLKSRAKRLSRAVLVGKHQRLPMYFHAQRVKPHLYQRRLKQRRRHASRKQRPLTAQQILFAGWTLYLTSVPDLTFAQVHTLYRARWQIECLFKRWKSLAHLDASSTTDPDRRACELLAKLLAVLLAHWLTQAYAWPSPHLSPYLAFRTFQHTAALVALVLFRFPAFAPLLDLLLTQSLAAASLSRRRKHPNAVQLWQRFDLLA